MSILCANTAGGNADRPWRVTMREFTIDIYFGELPFGVLRGFSADAEAIGGAFGSCSNRNWVNGSGGVTRLLNAVINTNGLLTIRINAAPDALPYTAVRRVDLETDPDVFLIAWSTEPEDLPVIIGPASQPFVGATAVGGITVNGEGTGPWADYLNVVKRARIYVDEGY